MGALPHYVHGNLSRKLTFAVRRPDAELYVPVPRRQGRLRRRCAMRCAHP